MAWFKDIRHLFGLDSRGNRHFAMYLLCCLALKIEIVAGCSEGCLWVVGP